MGLQMAQWLRALNVLSEDPRSIPSNNVPAATMRSDTFTQTYMQVKHKCAFKKKERKERKKKRKG